VADAAPDAPYDLLSADYDLPAGRGPVRRSYLICSTPRSGSTLLAEAMHRTARLGIPAEYLEVQAAMPYLYRRWGCSGFEDYVGRLHQHRSGDGGVFGVKAHWHQVIEFSNLSQGAEPLADVDFRVIAGVLGRVVPNPVFLYVTRRDKARQAVSHWLADKTRRWIDLGSKPVTEVPPYDAGEIARFAEGIDASEAAWDRFFDLARVEPLRVVYEDFVAAYDDTVRRAAAHGVETDALPVPPPRMRRQSNEASKAYAERFRAEWAG